MTAHESPLEELLQHNLEKYLEEGVKLYPQAEVITFCGNYRMDFMAYLEGHPPIGLECDGQEFHDESCDEWRDAMILGSTPQLQAIYRFPGGALFYRTEDCLYLLSRWEPHLFSERGRTNLRRLASEHAVQAGDGIDFSGVFYTYPPVEGKGPIHTKIERHVIEAPPGKRTFLKTIWDYAQASGLNDLEEIKRRYRSRSE